MTRRDEVLELLRTASGPLDDDEIASRLRINRHYVNTVCRDLAADGLASRFAGPTGKLVTEWPQGEERSLVLTANGNASSPRPARLHRSQRTDRNVASVIDNFTYCVDRFEATEAFAGPSLYFHCRAIDLRRTHVSCADLLADERFLEYVYAVLPAWGMHRMGRQRAKVVDFEDMVASFRSAEPAIDRLWSLDLRTTSSEDAPTISEEIWRVIAALRVSRSETRIVAGTKALHHVLPDLVPPMDRQYTFRFFTGQKTVTIGEERAFCEWFPQFCAIGRARRPEIDATIGRGGFMATGPAKVIDNAIMGFMQAGMDSQ